MKKTTLVILSFVLLSLIKVYAQNYKYETVNEISSSSSTSYTYGGGGYAIPSIGNFHVLIIFAEFPDDTYDVNNTRWPKGSAPANMSGWVDQTWSGTNSCTQGSLTHYFNVMSGERFHLTGETIHVVAPKTRSQYYSLGMWRGDIQKEIIESLDATISFANYDNWSRTNWYTHNNSPETPIGQVDMIIFIWRNVHADFSDFLDFSTNYGDLGCWYNSYWKERSYASYPVDGGLRVIKTDIFGSGITIKAYLGGCGGEYDHDPFRVVIHEFSHYLLGGNDMHNGYGFWGMLCDWGTRSYVANAFERYQLGWINV